MKGGVSFWARSRSLLVYFVNYYYYSDGLIILKKNWVLQHNTNHMGALFLFHSVW